MEGIAPAWELRKGDSPESVLWSNSRLFIDNFRSKGGADNFIRKEGKERRLSIRPFGVEFISVKEDGEVTKWKKRKGFSVWEGVL